PGIVQTRQHAGRDHFAEHRLDCLLIRLDKVDAGKSPDGENPDGNPAARPVRSRLRLRRHWRNRDFNRYRAHCAPPWPRVKIFSNSESELRIAVVLSSITFLYESSVRSSLYNFGFFEYAWP